jgi:hypothetical protein
VSPRHGRASVRLVLRAGRGAPAWDDSTAFDSPLSDPSIGGISALEHHRGRVDPALSDPAIANDAASDAGPSSVLTLVVSLVGIG